MSLNVTSTYVGNDANFWISKALLSGKTLSSNMLTVFSGIKEKTHLHKLDTSGLLQAYSCDFTPSGTVNISDRALTPVDFKVNLTMCYDTLRKHWVAEQMRPGANQTEIPATLQDYIVKTVAASIAEEIEHTIYKGDTAAGSYRRFDGFVKLMDADADVEKVDTPVALTQANVISKFSETYAMIPDTIIDKEDLVFIASTKTAKLYKMAIAAQSHEKYFIGDVELDYLGVKIFATGGMTDDTIVAIQKSNLYFGTDLISDFSEIQLIDQKPIDGSDNVKVIVKGRACIAYGMPAEIVLYKA